MNLKLVGILAAVVIGFVGIGILGGGDDNTGSSNASTTNHTVGSSELGLKLTEAADFECPACRQFYPILDQIKEEYKDRVEFQFQHFPLTSIHRNALAAHRAAEAAGNQGKFYEMHDLLFQQQEAWNGPSSIDPVGVETSEAITLMDGYAEQLELDIDQFKADFADPLTNSIINADISAMRESGADSTPTFFFNGEKVPNSQLGTIEAMRLFLDEKIEEAGGETTTTEEDAATDADAPVIEATEETTQSDQ